MSVASGANTGAKTDASGDDQAHFATGSATMYLGTGATSSVGGQMLPGAATSVKLRATVNANVSGGSTILNTVQVSYKGATIPTQVIAPVSSATTSAVASQIDLQVAKTDSQTSASAGAPITYVVTIHNNGPQTASNVTVTDTIPSMVLSPTWTCSVAGQSVAASCGAPSGSGNIATTVSLGSGDTATYTVSGTVDPAASAGTATLANTATAAATGDQHDTNTANNSATDTDDVLRQADIQVSKTDGITNAVPGTALTYTVTVTNAGPANAGTVTIADTVPAAITGVSVELLGNGWVNVRHHQRHRQHHQHLSQPSRLWCCDLHNQRHAEPNHSCGHQHAGEHRHRNAWFRHHGDQPCQQHSHGHRQRHAAFGPEHHQDRRNC